jgi:hypothetical protein
MKKFSITYMKKDERKSITVNCDWFSVYTLGQVVCIVFENSDSPTGETIVLDLISWQLGVYPASY